MTTWKATRSIRTAEVLLRRVTKKPMSATPVQAARAIVLSVEDDDNEQRLLKSILEERGLNVLQASTAAIGLQLFREHLVSLVIIDQRLGNKKITGAQLARKIKAINRNVPIVLRSGYPAPEMGKTWDVFVSKAESVEAFVALIEDLSGDPLRRETTLVLRLLCGNAFTHSSG